MSENPSAIEAWSLEMPKVGLHCHLEGTVHARTFRELASHAGYDIGSRAAGSPDQAYRFDDFFGFLRLFRDVCAVLTEPAAYERIAAEFASEAARQHIRYAEVFVSPSAWLRMHPRLDVRAVFAAIRAACDANAPETTIAFIYDLTRNFGVDQANEGLEIACAMRDFGVIGVGLGGDEAGFPASLFERTFCEARSRGLRVTVHAGEADGPASVRAAVERLGAERIGHGVRAVEDPAVMGLLRERAITVEQAPTSNRLTGAVLGEHPVAQFVDQGIAVAIDADDPALFGTSITMEHALVARAHGPRFALARAADAVVGSFASPAHKAELQAELASFAAEPLPEFPPAAANR